jgi:hypothetical protein
MVAPGVSVVTVTVCPAGYDPPPGVKTGLATTIVYRAELTALVV